MKYSLKFALLGLLLLAAVSNCQKKKGKKGGKKSKSAAGAECPAEIQSNNKNYPHQLTVTNTGLFDGYTCGGTWLSEDVVITAGHCVTDKQGKALKPGSLSVATGVRSQALLRSSESRSVKEVKLHPGFKRVKAAGLKKAGQRDEEPVYFTNDVAILKLNKPMNLFGMRSKEDAMKGKYAVLPEGKDAVTEGVEVGFLNPGKGLLEFKSVLLWERAIKIVDKAECAKSEELSDAKADVEAGKTICGDSLEKCEEYEKSCDRQTGGGLLCKGKGKDVLCGIQTTHHCDEDERPPQTYLNVAEYKEWIDKEIGGKGEDEEEEE